MSHFGLQFAGPAIDLDKLRGWKESVVGQADQGLGGARQAAQGAGRDRRGEVHRPAPGRGRHPGGPQERIVRPLHHRGGLAGGQDPGLPIRRPAPAGLDQRARSRRHPQADAGHRRGHHRPGDGHGVRCPRLQDQRGRAARRIDSRRRSRHHPAPAQAHREALRSDPAQNQGDQDRSAARGVARHVRRRGGPGPAGVRPHPAVGRAPPQRQGHQRRSCRGAGQRARLHRSEQPDAHQRAAHLSPSETWSASPCWRTRRPTKASSLPR